MDVVIKKSKINDNWLLFVLASCLLLLYTISRIISLSRRIRDVEARPPVDEIVLRGLIRQEVQSHAEKLDHLIEEKFENMDIKLENVEVKLQQDKVAVEEVPVIKEEPKRSNLRSVNKKKEKIKEPKIVNELDLSHPEEI